MHSVPLSVYRLIYLGKQMYMHPHMSECQKHFYDSSEIHFQNAFVLYTV